ARKGMSDVYVGGECLGRFVEDVDDTVLIDDEKAGLRARRPDRLRGESVDARDLPRRVDRRGVGASPHQARWRHGGGVLNQYGRTVLRDLEAVGILSELQRTTHQPGGNAKSSHHSALVTFEFRAFMPKRTL